MHPFADMLHPVVEARHGFLELHVLFSNTTDDILFQILSRIKLVLVMWIRGINSHSSIFHSLCRNPKTGQYLHHNHYEYFNHSRSRWDVGVNLEPAHERFDECVLVSTEIFSRIGNLGVKQATLNYRIGRERPGGERRFPQKLFLLARMPERKVFYRISTGRTS